MKRLIVFMMSFLILTGCSTDKADVSAGIKLRQRLQEGDSCAFSVVITADYGDRVYSFGMDCVSKPSGEVSFIVCDPESLQGISGSVSETGGKLSFDGTVLLFESLTQGQVTPVIAPWLMAKAIRGGYITAVSERDGEKELVIDDTFCSEKFRVLLTLEKNGDPRYCEIYWQNRRILSLSISNFSNG